MIGRHSSWVVGNSLLGAAMGYVALLAMARYMGDALLGARAYVLSIVFLLGIVTRLGFPTTHARRLARGDDIPGSNGTYLVMKMGLTALFLVVSSTVLVVWFHILDRPATDVTEQALWIGVAIVFLKSLRDFLVNTFRGMHLILEREAVLFINTLVTVVFTTFAALAYAHGTGRWSPVPGLSAWVARLLGVSEPATFAQGLIWLMVAYLVGEAAALLLGILLFLRRRIPVGAPDRSTAIDYLHATVPIMFIVAAGLLMRRIDQVMLGFWRTNAELGHYAAATKLTELVLILATGIQVVLLPMVAKLQKEGRMADLRAMLIDTERWISLLVWPVVIAGSLAAAPIIHIVLSDAFLPAAPLLILLLVASLLNSLSIPLRTKALGLGQQGFAARASIAAVATNIVLNIILIPDSVGPVPAAGLGAVGASIATIAAAVVLIVAYRERAHDWTRHPMFSIHLQKHLLAAAATGAIVWLALPHLPAIERFYDLGWYGLLVAFVFYAITWLLREVDGGDLRRAWNIVRAKKEPEVMHP